MFSEVAMYSVRTDGCWWWLSTISKIPFRANVCGRALDRWSYLRNYILCRQNTEQRTPGPENASKNNTDLLPESDSLQDQSMISFSTKNTFISEILWLCVHSLWTSRQHHLEVETTLTKSSPFKQYFQKTLVINHEPIYALISPPGNPTGISFAVLLLSFWIAKRQFCRRKTLVANTWINLFLSRWIRNHSHLFGCILVPWESNLEREG